MREARTWVETTADDAHVRRERAKARALRQSAWWRAQLAKGRCHYCGGTFPPAELTMDHLVPVARGGRYCAGSARGGALRSVQSVPSPA